LTEHAYRRFNIKPAALFKGGLETADTVTNTSARRVIKRTAAIKRRCGSNHLFLQSLSSRDWAPSFSLRSLFSSLIDDARLACKVSHAEEKEWQGRSRAAHHMYATHRTPHARNLLQHRDAPLQRACRVVELRIIRGLGRRTQEDGRAKGERTTLCVTCDA
jgi:hypothetical protein